MIKMQIVTVKGCECCEEIKKYIEDVKKDFLELEVEILDSAEYPDLIKKYNILSAPGIIINDKLEFTGETKEEDLRKKLEEIKNS